jgi:uncharacterized protein with HEPN domain
LQSIGGIWKHNRRAIFRGLEDSAHHRTNAALDKKLYAVMEKIAKFRNIVVHHYDKVDAEIVIAILKNDLADFSRYKQAIVKFLEKDKTESRS